GLRALRGLHRGDARLPGRLELRQALRRDRGLRAGPRGRDRCDLAAAGGGAAARSLRAPVLPSCWAAPTGRRARRPPSPPARPRRPGAAGRRFCACAALGLALLVVLNYAPYEPRSAMFPALLGSRS